ncbi:MAG: WD40 repeat domain-containing protein [Armatimonadota bacterium]
MRFLLCLILLSSYMATSVFAAEPSGRMFYVKVSGDTADAPADVYEQNYNGGEAKLLISHTALPKSFRGRIEHVLPCADGNLLLLQESDGVTIRDAKTGVSHIELGSGYTTINDEEVTDQFKGGYWLWTRADGSLKKIYSATEHESLDSTAWSPSGRLLLLCVANFDTGGLSIRIYDAATGKTRKIFDIQDFTLARWCMDSSGILIVHQPKVSTSRVTIVTLTGKVKHSFTHPGRVFTAAISPNGKQIAVGDKGGFSILTSSGRVQHKLAIPVAEGLPSGEMAFTADGRRLAVLYTTTSSGPYADVNESLWVTDAQTAATRLVAKWETTLGNSPGEDNTHTILGWVPVQPALLIESRSCTSQGFDTEWQKLWLQTIGPTNGSRLLADTGIRSIDMSCCIGIQPKSP